MKKKIPKASKKRLALFGTVSVIIIFYFVFLLGYYIYNIFDLKSEQALLEAEYNELKKDEKELRTEIEKLQDEDYIARYARENYSYSKDGEYIIKISDSEKEEEKLNSLPDNEYKYVIYGGILIIFIIIIYALKKKK